MKTAAWIIKTAHNRLKNVYGLIIGIVLFYFLVSCSCNYHIEKAKQKCGYTLKNDTITYRDTIYTNNFRKDTIFNFYNSKDTIFLKQNNVIVKYFHHDSLIYLSAAAKKDTIIIYKKIPVQKTEIKQEFFGMNKRKIILILFILIFSIIICNELNIFKHGNTK